MSTELDDKLFTPELAARLLAPREVADMLGCSTHTVYRRIHAGHLPAYRLRGLGPNPPLRIAPEDLYEWLRPQAKTRTRKR